MTSDPLVAEQPVPLFLLKAVQFPGSVIALRVFETRYIDMVRRCLRADGSFGLVAIRRGEEVGAAEPYRVGTIARIVDWARTPEGLLGLSVRSMDRFRFESVERAPDGLYLARGASILPSGRTPVLAAQAWATDLLESLLEQAPPAGPDSAYESPPALDDADSVCWNLARRLPLELSERQALLEIDDVDRRFEQLRMSAAMLVDESEQGD